MKNCLPKIAITGADGQLANAIYHHPNLSQFDSQFFSRAQVDITQDDRIEDLLSIHRPDIVINTAAYTAVDKAETESQISLQINHEAVKKLAIACQAHKVALLQISTDYVFDGNKTTPYHEESTANPINTYGKSKYLGELAVRQYCDQYIILRISGVFSQYGHNFLKTIIRLAQEKKQLQIVADQITCPTYAGHIANAILTLIQNPKWSGTYHFCSSKPVSWYHFAETVVAELRNMKSVLVEEIKPIPAAEYKSIAKRPAYSVLNCDKIKHDFDILQPDWKEAIKTILRETNNGLST